MAKRDKLLKKMLSKPTPKDFLWPNLVAIMKSYGFELTTTNGSGRKFIYNGEGGVVVCSLHQPHKPANILKPYAINLAIEALQQIGAI